FVMSEYVTLTVDLPKDLHERLKRRAEQTGRNPQELMLEILMAEQEAFLEKEETTITSFREPSPQWRTRSVRAKPISGNVIDPLSSEAYRHLEDDPLFHIVDLTKPDEVIEGERPTDTAKRHDYYLYGVDLDASPSR
ncbi:MAG: hypothetical protein GXP42_10475, partial [Chloroflexi bacterium]|nr:hypothetical protein [Chloroflexota bacterium]